MVIVYVTHSLSDNDDEIHNKQLCAEYLCPKHSNELQKYLEDGCVNEFDGYISKSETNEASIYTSTNDSADVGSLGFIAMVSFILSILIMVTCVHVIHMIIVPGDYKEGWKSLANLITGVYMLAIII